MEDKIKSFVNEYYQNDNLTQLDLTSSLEMPVGQFDRYSLGISFSGIDEHYLQNTKKTLKELEEKTKDIDINKISPTEELIQEYPEVISIFIGQELFSHEYFHLFQSLTLPSFYKLYESSREVASLKVMILVYLIKEKRKFCLNERKSIFEYIENIKSKENKRSLYSLFDIYRNNSLTINNFFNYKDNSLNIVDIIEGAAYNFQKLMNRTIDIETFIVKDESVYNISFKYFLSKGGNDRCIFLLISHLSLKYGILDDGDFMDIIPTPVDLFKYLCKNTNKYEENIDPDFRVNFECSGINSNLDGWNIDTDKSKEICKIYKVYKKIKNDAKEYLNNNGVRKIRDSFKLSDPRSNELYKAINDKYPSFNNGVFLSLLLSDFKFSSNFIFSFLPNIKNVTYDNIFEAKVSTFEDDLLYNISEDFDMLLRKGVTYCCSKHGIVPYRKIMQCKSDISFYTKVNRILGVELDRTILTERKSMITSLKKSFLSKIGK